MLTINGGVEIEAAAPPPPSNLRGFRSIHEGEPIVVCGCGSSLRQLVAPERYTTIGVNDVGRQFQPDYLVVLNPKHQFSGDRYRYVEESRATAVFSQIGLRLPHAPVVPIRLGRRGGVDNGDPDVLHYTRNSPYLATCLALHMGAKRIGLIGVDFTDHHFFGTTGRHSLAGEFETIDREYCRLAEECSRRGIEVVNLSEESRLTAFPKVSPERFAITSLLDPASVARGAGRRVFFVHYRFLTCGEVFRDGLESAARDLGVEYEGAHWDDAALPEKVARFSPELLFVVHGRSFHSRWPGLAAQYNSAVWLLDEPYEVDDTSRFSRSFRTVFVNDPGTLNRHTNAHYLPVAYDPHSSHYLAGGNRSHRVGFIGGANPAREKILASLARSGLLSYVVGGPWQDAALQRLSLGGSIPAARTAALYRDSEIVLNVFRTKHHFNREQTPAFSLNPRVYEAAGCGALPLSEPRPELTSLWPGAPVFRDGEQLAEILEELRADPVKKMRLIRAAVRGLRQHTYSARLSSALEVTLESRPAPAISEARRRSITLKGWEPSESVVSTGPDDIVILSKEPSNSPGSEDGLIGTEVHGDAVLEFEVWLEPGSCFLAKLHQQDACGQASNSYHLCASGGSAYVARHNHYFRRFTMRENAWHQVKLVWCMTHLLVRLNGEVVCSTRDDLLRSGYCFLGVKGGRARLRGIKIYSASAEDAGVVPVAPPAYSILAGEAPQKRPLLSIVTTVYDRTACLDRCLRSVNALTFQDYEHIVVADSPPPGVTDELGHIIARRVGPRGRVFANLRTRHNNWGIAPAAAGLAMASGKYIAFLSDDNGYLPDHFEPLIETLESDPGLGFVYSSCMYAGRTVLKNAPPRPGRIDLGQPLFRKDVLDVHLDGTLPFSELAWDWRMIELLMRKGTRWKHIDRTTFVFRLDRYPHLVEALP